MNGASGRKSYGRLDAGGMTICKTHKKDLIMRLWHQALIPYLDNKRLCAQHRECCALRGKGWGRKHATVDYVFKYDLAHLCAYHCLVLFEMNTRNYKVNSHWFNYVYRGNEMPLELLSHIGTYRLQNENEIIYDEHDDRYLKECLLNLKSKGAELINGKTVDGMLLELDLKGVK